MQNLIHIVLTVLPFIVAYYIIVGALLLLLVYKEEKNQETGLALKAFSILVALPITIIITMITILYLIVVSILDFILRPDD